MTENDPGMTGPHRSQRQDVIILLDAERLSVHDTGVRRDGGNGQSHDKVFIPPPSRAAISKASKIKGKGIIVSMSLIIMRPVVFPKYRR